MSLSKEELGNRVRDINEIFKDVLEDFDRLGTERKKQFETGVNKAYGQARAFLHEYATAAKAQNKGREIIAQTHADVTVGRPDQAFAKSIECKSVTAPKLTDVNKQIAKALKQLAGLTGHKPRGDDVRVIDVLISGPNNAWPVRDGNYESKRDAETLQTITDAAVANIKAALDSKEDGAQGIANWLNGMTYEQPGSKMPSPYPYRDLSFWHPNSTRLLYSAGADVYGVRCLTVKVRYEERWQLIDPTSTKYRGLQSMTIHAYRRPADQRLSVSLAKTVVYELDMNAMVTDDNSHHRLLRRDGGGTEM